MNTYAEIHMRHFHLNRQKAPCLPPPPPLKKRKKLQNHCFQFPLGITALAREIEDNGGGGGKQCALWPLCKECTHA